jgi:hypothetical protein
MNFATSVDSATTSRRHTREQARPQPPEQPSQPETGGDSGGSVAAKPWHLFTMGGLLTATVVVVLARGTGPVNVLFLALIVGSAALAAAALFRTLWPLVATDSGESTEMLGGRTREALEREKVLALRSIKELEFDFAMEKTSEADFQEMLSRLRLRAIRLMKQLDTGGSIYRELIERDVRALMKGSGTAVVPLTQTAAPSEDEEEGIEGPGHVEPRERSAAAVAESGSLCRACGSMNEDDARFCQECGERIGSVRKAECSACGTANAPGARFCKGCGTSMQQASVAAEESRR